MMRRFGLWLFVVALSCSVCGVELDSLTEMRSRLWRMTGYKVSRHIPGVFSWVDAAKTRMHYNARQNKTTSLTLFGTKVQDAVINFSHGRVSDLNISIYNRGDAGTMPEKAFEELLKTFEKELTPFVGKNVRPKFQNMTFGGSRMRSKVWSTDSFDAELRWCLTRDKPEFITFNLYPPGEAPKSLREEFKTTAVTADLRQRVKDDLDGSRYVLVPMVDQGAKGYCVAATIARILRYYGSDIDQHVVAKLAETDARTGTTLNKIIKVLESNQSKLGIRFQELYRYDELEDFRDLKKLCRKYNSIASRQKTKKIKLEDYMFAVGRIRYLNYGALMKGMDFKIFSAIRGRDGRGEEKFSRRIRANINDGIPLCWSTYIFPAVDKESSEFGMHMRIITGYNTKTGAIIYSDSWGVGNEKKEMKVEDAWAITVNLISIEPRHRNKR